MEQEPLTTVESAPMLRSGVLPCGSSATISNLSPSPSRTTVSSRTTRCRFCSTSRRSTSTTIIPRKSSQGTGNDSEGQAAEQRSGNGRERTFGAIVEVVESAALLPSPPVGEGGVDEVRAG